MKSERILTPGQARVDLADELLAIAAGRDRLDEHGSVRIPRGAIVAGLPLGFLLDADRNEAKAWVRWALCRTPGCWPVAFAAALRLFARVHFPDVLAEAETKRAA